MMEAVSAFHFERPAWLLLLLPALALWLLQRRISDASECWRRVIDPVLLRHLLVGREQPSRATPNALFLLGSILGTIAVAGPAWELEPSPFADAKPPAMIVLRVTPSMTTDDLAPTRLDRARQKLSDLLGLREGAATGLIAYSGTSHLVLPPTPTVPSSWTSPRPSRPGSCRRRATTSPTRWRSPTSSSGAIGAAARSW
ncbi:hypothetical protein [Methylobacterium durans]|uniref:hypothetical protein n=1 Tax=Methylobacterium durans TaxID=2202825 RepID=UPI001F29EAC2|nr:hypothetical protein [Methylobacterium durans]